MKNTYLHPLDYVIGAKYYLVPDKLDVEFRVSSRNFYVEELLDFNELGLNSESGSYVVLEIVKKDVDTFTVLEKLGKAMGIPRENIVYLGLKDKYSTSKQYFFIKRELYGSTSLEGSLNGNQVSARFIGYVRRKPRRRHHIGNRFKVFVENCSGECLERARNILKSILKHGLPSYFGYQRFGVKRYNNHVLGKYLVIGRTDLFIEELLYNIYPLESINSIRDRLNRRFGYDKRYEALIYKCRDPWRAVKFLDSVLNHLFIDAYSSYLYNLLLNKVVETHGWSGLDSEYPMVGCSGSYRYYRDLLRIEGVSKNSLYLFKCWFRRGLFKPLNIDINKIGDGLELVFTLKSGFYASIVLREFFKDKLLFT